ncbi:response regulator [Hydrogenophaga sp.]|uniref:response regulator n=1 Tax=Hydrogenophaga sp. TaxID=1904254 RepID=UPI003F6D5595
MSTEYCGTFEAARLLGLSVGTVQSLVERGELEAWKTQGGHRRIATQSLRDYQARHGQQAISGAESDPMLRVLVVDDDLVTLEVVRAATEQWKLPLACTLMPSAVDALLQIGTLRPHVLLTDLSMPGVDGFELLHSLRSNPAFASMLLVAITGLSKSEVKVRGGLPADTVLVKKPLDLRWLHGFLSALVASRQLKAAQI